MSEFRLKHVSHSAAKNFLSCGERYRLEKVEHHYGLPHMGAIGGSAFHNWTEELDLLNQLDSRFIPSWETFLADALEQEAEKHYSKTGEELNIDQIRCSRGEPYEWWLAKGEIMCEKYRQWREETRWTVDVVELPYEQDLGLAVPALGYIDREFIDQDGNRILVDLKSGRKIDNDSQLFEYAVIRRLQGVKIDYVAYYNARKGVLLDLQDPTAHTVAWLKNAYGNVINKINLGIFVANPGRQCNWCSVRDICAFREGNN